MGLISISFDQNCPILKKYLVNGYSSNSDGAGFAYLENGIIKVKKGFFTFNEFYSEYKKISKNIHLVNFREEKQGGKTVENTGPFLLTDKLAVAHVGFFTQKEFDSDTKSDTRVFIEKILRPMIQSLGENVFRSKSVQFLLQDFCGYFDNLVFFYADAEPGQNFVIINNTKGSFEDKNKQNLKSFWFSGHDYGYSFKYSPPTVKKYDWEFDSTSSKSKRFNPEKNPYDFDDADLDAVDKHINDMTDDEFAKFEDDGGPPEDESDEEEFDRKLRHELLLAEFRRDDENFRGNHLWV